MPGLSAGLGTSTEPSRFKGLWVEVSPPGHGWSCSDRVSAWSSLLWPPLQAGSVPLPCLPALCREPRPLMEERRCKGTAAPASPPCACSPPALAAARCQLALPSAGAAGETEGVVLTKSSERVGQV